MVHVKEGIKTGTNMQARFEVTNRKAKRRSDAKNAQ
jgi:hypothetical protein